eukprot:g8097.t1
MERGARNCDVLILGCGSVGKSHILRYLRKLTSNTKDRDEAISIQSQSTVGVEIDFLRLNTSKYNRKQKREVRIREVGSPMMPMWNCYSKDCFALIYVVDGSNRTQVTESSIEFFKVLNHLPPNDRHFPILVVNNKIDCVKRLSESEISHVFCFDALNEGDQVAIKYLETTFLKREDAFQYGEAILTWIDEKLD